MNPPAPRPSRACVTFPSAPVPGGATPGIINTMKITSEKKAAAARANGALSHGPTTPEGKARSSQNALQHGLFSTTVVLATEDPEEFRALLDDYCDYYQ